MAKQFAEYETKRSDCLWFNPEDLVLVTDKKSPYYDERVELPVDEALVANILFNMQGVLEPVIITRDGDEPTVLAGRQRVKAAIEANKKLEAQGATLLKVPCVLKRGNEVDLYALGISENEHRKDDGIVAKAKKLQHYYNIGGNAKDAAEIFGVSIQAIKNWEKVLDLASGVIKAIEADLISASAAAKLASLPKAEQVEKLVELLKGKKPSGKKVGKAAGKSTPKKPKCRSYKVIEQLIETSEDMPEDAKTALEWVMCKTDDLPVEWM